MRASQGSSTGSCSRPQHPHAPGWAHALPTPSSLRAPGWTSARSWVPRPTLTTPRGGLPGNVTIAVSGRLPTARCSCPAPSMAPGTRRAELGKQVVSGTNPGSPCARLSSREPGPPPACRHPALCPDPTPGHTSVYCLRRTCPARGPVLATTLHGPPPKASLIPGASGGTVARRTHPPAGCVLPPPGMA